MNNILGMFRGSKNPLEKGGITSAPADGDMLRCPICKNFASRKEIAKNKAVCKSCGHHFRVSARNRIVMIADRDSFFEFDRGITSADPLEFPGYAEKLSAAGRDTGENEAVITGVCEIGGVKCALFVMEPRFIMGSMGSAVGEKLTRLFEYATEEKLPVVGFTASGGARMQEGILSLMQMAKVSGAVGRHSDAGGLYVTVLTDPTTGGVTASFAMLGDIILAEPGALVGFAGRRVIEKAAKKKLPDDFQSAELLRERGFCDAIVPRTELKKTLALILRLHPHGESGCEIDEEPEDSDESLSADGGKAGALEAAAPKPEDGGASAFEEAPDKEISENAEPENDGGVSDGTDGEDAGYAFRPESGETLA